jgi:hypothetical protein
MANNPNVPRQSLAESHAALAAQNTYQAPHQGITGWHPYTQSLGACALQSGSLQAAIPPQQLSPKVGRPVKYVNDLPLTHDPFLCTVQQDLSNLSTVTQPSQPASVLYSEDVYEDASSTSSSVREEEESKEVVSETCPLPECEKDCGRPQELERHFWERHLPPHRYCGQPGCNFIGSRPYLLKGHHSDNHPDVLEQDVFIIYDAKVLAKQVRTKEIGIEEAVRKAYTLFEEKRKQEGKLWCWPGTNGLI